MLGSVTRRTFVAGLLSAPVLAALPPAVSRSAPAHSPALEFDILRHDSPIGEHSIAAERTAEGLRVAIRTDIRVRVLGITAYRYEHRGTEEWQQKDDTIRLVGLQTRTDDNGKSFAVDGTAEGKTFRVEGNTGQVVAPANVVPASYWTPLALHRSQLLGPKRGNLYPIEIEMRGRETIESAGERIAADHFFIQGDPATHLWYDDEQRIRRLAFESRGEFIDYRLRQMNPFGLNERIF